MGELNPMAARPERFIFFTFAKLQVMGWGGGGGQSLEGY